MSDGNDEDTYKKLLKSAERMATPPWNQVPPSAASRFGVE